MHVEEQFSATSTNQSSSPIQPRELHSIKARHLSLTSKSHLQLNHRRSSSTSPADLLVRLSTPTSTPVSTRARTRQYSESCRHLQIQEPGLFAVLDKDVYDISYQQLQDLHHVPTATEGLIHYSLPQESDNLNRILKYMETEKPLHLVLHGPTARVLVIPKSRYVKKNRPGIAEITMVNNSRLILQPELSSISLISVWVNPTKTGTPCTLSMSPSIASTGPKPATNPHQTDHAPPTPSLTVDQLQLPPLNVPDTTSSSLVETSVQITIDPPEEDKAPPEQEETQNNTITPPVADTSKESTDPKTPPPNSNNSISLTPPLNAPNANSLVETSAQITIDPPEEDKAPPDEIEISTSVMVKPNAINEPNQQTRHSLRSLCFDETILNLGKSMLITCLETEKIDFNASETVPCMRSKLMKHYNEDPSNLQDPTLDIVVEGMKLTTTHWELTRMGDTADLSNLNNKEIKTRLSHLLKGLPNPTTTWDQTKMNNSDPGDKDHHKLVDELLNPSAQEPQSSHKRFFSMSQETISSAFQSMGEGGLKKCIRAESLGTLNKNSKTSMRDSLIKSLTVENKHPTNDTLMTIITSLTKPFIIAELKNLDLDSSGTKPVTKDRLIDALVAKKPMLTSPQQKLVDQTTGLVDLKWNELVEPQMFSVIKFYTSPPWHESQGPDDLQQRLLASQRFKSGISSGTNPLTGLCSTYFMFAADSPWEVIAASNVATNRMVTDDKERNNSDKKTKQHTEGDTITKPVEKKKEGREGTKEAGAETKDIKAQEITSEDPQRNTITKSMEKENTKETKTEQKPLPGSEYTNSEEYNTCLRTQHSVIEDAIVKLQHETNSHDATLNLLLEDTETKKKKQTAPISETRLQALENRIVASETLCLTLSKEVKDLKEQLRLNHEVSETPCLTLSKEVKDLKEQLRLNHEDNNRRCEILDDGFRDRLDGIKLLITHFHPSKTKSQQSLLPNDLGAQPAKPPLTVEKEIQSDMSKISAKEKVTLGHAIDVSNKPPHTVTRRIQTDMSEISAEDKKTLGHSDKVGPSHSVTRRIQADMSVISAEDKNTLGYVDKMGQSSITWPPMNNSLSTTETPSTQPKTPNAMTALLPLPTPATHAQREGIVETWPPLNKSLPTTGTSLTQLQPKTPNINTALLPIPTPASYTQKGTNAESRTRRNTNTEWKRSSTSLSQPPDNESSRNTAGRSPNPQAGDHKCLILHDKHHQKILPVTRQGFLLESHNAGCLKSLKSYKLEDLIQKHKPGSVFVHLGLEDLQKHKDPEDLASDFKELMDYILVETQVKLCISSILKTKSPRLNDSIASVNRSIFSYSNKLRRESQAARERIFTFNNANVDKEILLSNDGISLNDYGTTKLAARLTHCLNKIQRANQKSSTISRQHNG